MGIHIIAYTLGKTITEEGFGCGEKYIENERYNSFDSIRMAGDTDFIFESDFGWKYKYDDPDKPDFENSYRRPEDLNRAKDWIQKNIPEGNQNRLITLIDDMAQNQNLWISVSY